MTMDLKTWQEFKNAGMLWFINRLLHIFGWAIIYEYNDDDTAIVQVYPARLSARGFAESVEVEGFKKISKYMVENAPMLQQEAHE